MRLNPIRDAAKESHMLSEFQNLLSHIRCLKARVYSIVNNVVRLSMLNSDNELYERDISSDLIKIGLFEKCEESRISIEQHEERMNTVFMGDSEKSKNNWINITNRDLEKIVSQVRFETHARHLKLNIYTPLTPSLFGMTNFTKAVACRVDSDSINSIILDEEHQIRCSSLLVSASRVTRNDDKIALRQTTLFPKIKGLVSLCLLTFSPQIEFR